MATYNRKAPSATTGYGTHRLPTGNRNADFEFAGELTAAKATGVNTAYGNMAGNQGMRAGRTTAGRRGKYGR